MAFGSSIMFMFFGLAIWGVGLLLIVELIRTLVVALTRPRRYRPHPACEQCGYSVAGLAALQCPECGSDLRATGIITPRMESRRRGSTWGAIAAWSVLVALVWLFIGMVVSTAVLVGTARAGAASSAAAAGGAAGAGGPGIASVTETLTPASGAYGAVRTSITFTSPQTGMVGSSSAMLSVTDSGGRTLMFTANTAAGTGRFSWTDGLGQVRGSGTKPTSAEVLAWLKAAGAEETATGVAEEADELVSLLDGAAALTSVPAASVYAGTNFAAGGATTSFTAMPRFGALFDNAAIYQLAIVAVGLVVWGLGLWFIIARRRKMYREARAAPVG